jgi:hypothetical protein
MFFLTHDEPAEKEEKKSCTWTHEWSKWRVTARLERTSRFGDGGILGEVLVQERKCERCGFTELNKQKLDYNY